MAISLTCRVFLLYLYYVKEKNCKKCTHKSERSFVTFATKSIYMWRHCLVSCMNPSNILPESFKHIGWQPPSEGCVYSCLLKITSDLIIKILSHTSAIKTCCIHWTDNHIFIDTFNDDHDNVAKGHTLV